MKFTKATQPIFDAASAAAKAAGDVVQAELQRSWDEDKSPIKDFHGHAQEMQDATARAASAAYDAYMADHPTCARDVQDLVAQHGWGYAEYCVRQSEAVADVPEVRAEIVRLNQHPDEVRELMAG